MKKKTGKKRNPAERRELVRRGIKNFIVEHTKDWELKAKLGECLDKFCEEQGI